MFKIEYSRNHLNWSSCAINKVNKLDTDCIYAVNLISLTKLVANCVPCV